MKNLNKILAMLAFAAMGVFALSCGDDDPAKPVDGDGIKITSLTPSKILPAQIVKINGSGFGTEQGDGYIDFAGIRVEEYLSWTATEIKVRVPAITADGKVIITKGGKSSAGFDFTLNRDPYIERAGGDAAYPNEEVKVYGKNFGSAQGVVTFNGVSATTISKWTDGEVDVTVPAAASTGSLIIKNSAGVASNAYDFTVSKSSDPYIQIIDAPDVVEVGNKVTIRGANFGATQGASYVLFNGVKANNYESWGDKSIRVAVPAGAGSGLVKVVVNEVKSKGLPLDIKAAGSPPQIISLDKTTFKVDDEIEISGNYFGDDYDETTCFVYFGNKKAVTFSSWNNTKIAVIVPKDADNGQLYVEVKGKSSNKVDYWIYGATDPVISSINPAIATIGSSVTISGKNFGASRGTSVVTFNGAEAQDYIAWSATTIEVKVPEGATDGYVKVKVGDVTSPGYSFKIQGTYKLLDMAAIPAGSFRMGNPDPNGFDDYPTAQITLTKPFYMSKYEITQAQFKEIMNGSNPSREKNDKAPVDRVSWNRAVEFCNRLSQAEGYTPCYTKIKRSANDSVWVCNFNANGYRLPTEAEWEYAARATTTGKYYGSLSTIAWYNESKVTLPQEVGKKEPNAFGLYDMLGNVSEWVNDWYNSDYYKLIPLTDPKGPDYDVNSPDKVYRGGSYQDGADDITAFRRYSGDRTNTQWYLGFRVVRNK